VQSRDYETPEYTEETGAEYLNGLYVEDLTPTPAEDGTSEYEYDPNADTVEEGDSANYEQSSDAETTDNPVYESSMESSEEEN